ncbi:MAG: GAF domain-containing protein [Synechococcaceae cyanobacterium SM2_3_1]|nr:GAF domain-containing protein [Synechococcaceae cyanobacterium SM2_3_1]
MEKIHGRCLEGAVESCEEDLFLRLDGHTDWVRWQVQPWRESNGEIGGIIMFTEVITTPKLMETELRESEASIRTLHAIIAHATLSFEERVQQLLEMGCRRFNLDIGILALVEGDNYTVKGIHAPGFEIEVGTTFSLEQTYCQKTLTANQPIGFEHAQHSEWRQHPAYRAFRLEAYIGAPVQVRNLPYGTINFSSPDPRYRVFKTVDFEFLQLMAQWLGGEIERYEEKKLLEQQYLRTVLLEKITQEIRRSLDSQTVFQTAATQIGQAFKVDRCIIRTYVEDPFPRTPVVAEYCQPGYGSTMEVEMPVKDNPHALKVLSQGTKGGGNPQYP